jgi:hypothetical protein
VFSYQRGQITFGPDTHPDLFKDGGSRAHFQLPRGWDVVSAVDTGTFYTALIVAFSPEGDAFVLDEFPNYRYVAGLPERDEQITIPGWAGHVHGGIRHWGGRPLFWADANSQFKAELRMYGLHLLTATAPVETRTEITREYFQHNRIWLAPWLSVLPFELENARWPDEATAAGKFARVKDRDHTLDCLEHILARRPRGTPVESARPGGRWIDGFVGPAAQRRRDPGNPHLGAH